MLIFETTPGKFARQPQSVWLRRAILQIHLWMGISLGLYVVLISLSGSALVYRIELDRLFAHRNVLVSPSGPRMSEAALAAVARAAYARFKFEDVQILAPASPDAAAEVWLISGPRKLERLFNPYTGEDLGDTIRGEPGFVTALVNVHADLLGGPAGRRANGIGAVLVTLIGLTGLIVWWPGVTRWKRSLSIRLGSNWRRLNWDLHSALGFWLVIPVLLWTATGIYLSFPKPFDNLIAFLEIDGMPTPSSLSVDAVFAWLVRAHFGRTFGPWIKALWVFLGLIPPVLFMTGVLMWWNRTLRRRWRNFWRSTASNAEPAVTTFRSMG